MPVEGSGPAVSTVEWPVGATSPSAPERTPTEEAVRATTPIAAGRRARRRSRSPVRTVDGGVERRLPAVGVVARCLFACGSGTFAGRLRLPRWLPMQLVRCSCRHDFLGIDDRSPYQCPLLSATPIAGRGRPLEACRGRPTIQHSCQCLRKPGEWLALGRFRGRSDWPRSARASWFGPGARRARMGNRCRSACSPGP